MAGSTGGGRVRDGSGRQVYLASIHSVDRNLGRFLRALERLDLTQETVVIFTSDHGYNMGHHGIWHKGNGRWILETNQGSRPNMWESSLQGDNLFKRDSRGVSNAIHRLDVRMKKAMRRIDDPALSRMETVIQGD